ncbi:MAG: hypothetical protein U0638_12875 [Phycisphaerales bacterium]
MAPSLLFANVGTPLMLIGCGHLVLGNLIIGLCEGGLLSWWGGVKYKAAALKMIAANYISGLLGWAVLPVLVRWVDASFMDPPLYRAGLTLGVLVVVAFVLTVLVEWPLVLWSLQGSRRGRGARVAAGVWTQAASYAVLIPMYVSVSPMTLLTDYAVVRDVSGMAGGANGWVYYVDDRDGSVRRVRLDYAGDEKVGQVSDVNRHRRWEPLWARPEIDGSVSIVDGEDANAKIVATQASGVVGARTDEYNPDGPSRVYAIDFRADPSHATYSYWALPDWESGLRRIESEPGDSPNVRVTRELTFSNALMHWQAGSPVILPNGSVVFEFGDQIVIMDEQRRIGFLAIGSSPAVVLDLPGERDK